MGFPVSFEAYRIFFWERIGPVPVRNGGIGRPLVYGRPLAVWERWRRNRERRTGKPDPILMASGVSIFSVSVPVEDGIM